jgi:hypothetical protein
MTMTDGSLSATAPDGLHTTVFAVPRSMPKPEENQPIRAFMPLHPMADGTRRYSHTE